MKLTLLLLSGNLVHAMQANRTSTVKLEKPVISCSGRRKEWSKRMYFAQPLE
jgi:hypothetical protein